MVGTRPTLPAMRPRSACISATVVMTFIHAADGMLRQAQHERKKGADEADGAGHTVSLGRISATVVMTLIHAADGMLRQAQHERDKSAGYPWCGRGRWSRSYGLARPVSRRRR